MRIAFLTAKLIPAGVEKKMVDQFGEWEKHGAEVKVFTLNRSEIAPEYQTTYPSRFFLYRTRLQKPTASSRMAHAVLDWQPDMVYARSAMLLPGYRLLARRLPMVAEINTNILGETRLRAPRTYWYLRFTQPLLDRRLAGFVCVTHEIARLPQYAHVSGKVTVITNGIDLARFTPLPAPSNTHPRIVFLGREGFPWHGIDKILWMARELPHWQFDLVGINPASVENSTPGMPNIRYHGWLRSDEYLGIMRGADVAIGTLALHRNSMNELCSLKHREYAAFGIPIIMGARDADLAAVPGVLELPNSEDNVRTGLKKIIAFVESNIGQRISRDSIKHIDVSAKESLRIQFLKDVLDSRRK